MYKNKLWETDADTQQGLRLLTEVGRAVGGGGADVGDGGRREREKKEKEEEERVSKHGWPRRLRAKGDKGT